MNQLKTVLSSMVLAAGLLSTSATARAECYTTGHMPLEGQPDPVVCSEPVGTPKFVKPAPVRGPIAVCNTLQEMGLASLAGIIKCMPTPPVNTDVK